MIVMTSARDLAIAAYEARRAVLIAEARDDVLHRRSLLAGEKRQAARQLHKAAMSEEVNAKPDFWKDRK